MHRLATVTAPYQTAMPFDPRLPGSTSPRGGVWLRLASTATLMALVAGCSIHRSTQAGDAEWQPRIEHATYAAGSGPVVLVDSGHGNWHTAGGRFGAFARLLRADGYVVRDSTSELSRSVLADADLLVIANPLLGGEAAEWIAPTPSAFTATEIAEIEAWVADGGALLLIADHMPFPGAAAELATVFGIEFNNGFAMRPGGGGGVLTFTRSTNADDGDDGDGRLVDHPILEGRSGGERIRSVKSFTGQAFHPGAAEPLLEMPPDWELLLPREAWEFDAATPRLPTVEMVQGAVLHHGRGRVAAFGEAAMFTAQTVTRDGHTYRFGLNDPEAPHNVQFVLNVVHWLGGLLDG